MEVNSKDLYQQIYIMAIQAQIMAVTMRVDYYYFIIVTYYYSI